MPRTEDAGPTATGGVVFDWAGRAAAEALAGTARRARVSEPRRGPHAGAEADGDLGADTVSRETKRVRPLVRPLSRAEDTLIEGDNLEALKLLQDTHATAFKVVYIDPPYNTGSRLSYHDRAGRTAGRRAGGTKDHAAWLNMMLPRLLLARRLMRADGVFFASIDDGELAYLTMLGHRVFGEENFLGAFVHQRAKGGGQARFFIRGHDYVLAWARDIAQAGPFLGPKKPPAKYEDIDGRRYLVDDDVLRVSFGKYTRGTERRLMYEDILAVRGAAKLRQVDGWLAAGTHVLRAWGEPGADGTAKHAVVKLTPAEQASSKLYSIIRALGEQGRNALSTLGLGGLFSYPKPVELIKDLVLSQTFADRDALVLDFFAGSGTTGQAVLELNAADGGQRRFVLVQQPEPLRPAAGARVGGEGVRSPRGAEASEEADAAGITTISELMRERIRRVAQSTYGKSPGDSSRSPTFRDIRLG
ncbi:DNA methyltransferase [Brevibacterium sp. 91QC2O2]|uniref:site-specific DNA-methyltransferase n=1 Tax=Brevibacterium TaxID=1696 RepID=UPI00211CBB29|nr:MULTISPECIES: DNA methyltransferase [unclassified Brevibacterium]MCQ9369361.1 DNA methyltransferase [Brevibacterium sp. 91QC2O2]MCQ9386509.1 DNA methyltransferase [Brevibacterium sp. 68QC2CO]